MKSIICLPVDFRANSLGLESLLAEEIDSAPVLYHTVSRLTLCDDWKVVLLFEDGPRVEEDVSRARGMLGGLPFETFVAAKADVANRSFLRRGRLWSLRSWRGGLGSTSYYDEAGSPASMLEAARRFDAEAVGLITPDSPYVDPNLASQLFAWHYDRIRKARVTVTGVSPGLAPAVFNTEVLATFAESGLTLAASMVYRPEQPQRDLTTTEAHFESDLGLRLAPWRLTAHSLRQLEMMRALAALGCSPRSASATDVIQALGSHSELWAGSVPAKVEIEPTSRADAAPVYWRSLAAGREACDLPLEAFRRIAASIAPYKDAVLSFAGLGEPLLNAELADMVAAAREAGFLGVHVGTFGRLLDAAGFEALSDAGLDILSVALEAHTNETYEAVFGNGGLERVRSAVESAFAKRIAARREQPLIVAEITKARPAESDIEAFFDYWFSRCDWPVIRPFNDFAGQAEDLATIHMRTSSRLPCRKIFEEMYIDSEGIAYPCRQDARKTRPLGSAVEEGIPALWKGDFLEGLRAAHAAGDYGWFPLCEGCKDWYYA